MKGWYNLDMMEETTSEIVVRLSEGTAHGRRYMNYTIVATPDFWRTFAKGLEKQLGNTVAMRVASENANGVFLGFLDCFTQKESGHVQGNITFKTAEDLSLYREAVEVKNTSAKRILHFLTFFLRLVVVLLAVFGLYSLLAK